MKIKNISVTNFRGLKSVALTMTAPLNVIVGPNAIGKSTLLESIRLSKTVLAPRFGNESQNTLISLGALSPHGGSIGSRALDVAGLAYDPNSVIQLNTAIELSADDVIAIQNSVESLTMLILESVLGSNPSGGQLGFAQYLSTPEGQMRFGQMLSTTQSQISSLTAGSVVTLKLTLDPKQGTIRGEKILDQALIAILDRQQPVSKTLFSLFPSERTYPQGEQPLQLGAGDAQAQLLSHMAQPGTKYARLKQTIIHAVLLGQRETKLEDEFNLIFDNLLPGKKFAGVEFNHMGLFKIRVHDRSTQKTFDMDSMSSGEKGLVLTFLFLRLSLAKGGIVLLDEPELHLNSAVQERILPFIMKHCIDDLDVQIFLCTHSPEIVRAAFEEPRCLLFHLRATDDLTPILKQDHRELFEVFERLGSSTADVLFAKGNIYVEGLDDVQILQAGYLDMLTGYRITWVGGRGEIEREAPVLQEQEKGLKLKKRQLFLLDNDGAKTNLKSTSLVRVRQLERYCIENYLLEEGFLFDLISAHAKKPIESRGSFPNVLVDLAVSQAADRAIFATYEDMKLPPTGVNHSDMKGKSFAEVADLLATQIATAKEGLDSFEPESWKAAFVAKCEATRTGLEPEWRAQWRTICNGKRLIDDLYVRYEIGMGKRMFKKEIMARMAKEQRDDWRTLRQILGQELGIPTE